MTAPRGGPDYPRHSRQIRAALLEVLGQPVGAGEESQADAREMFSRLLDWMVDAGDPWVLDVGPRELITFARSGLRNDIKRELLALTSPSEGETS